MRKGYWKTLLWRLRGRVAQGINTLGHGSFSFVVHDICASDDTPLDEGVDILLALDSDGNALLIDPASTQINIHMNLTDESIASGLTLLDMIDKLQPQPAPVAELMALSADQHTLDRLMRDQPSRTRGVLDD
jgi:hypothetical protein